MTSDAPKACPDCGDALWSNHRARCVICSYEHQKRMGRLKRARKRKERAGEENLFKPRAESADK